MVGDTLIKIIQGKFKKMNKGIQLLLLFCIILMIFCFACSDKNNYEETKGKKRDFNSKEIVFREAEFYENGMLKVIGYADKTGMIGQVKQFDSLGRKVRISRYGRTDELKNLLVEDIVFDSLGIINRNKSFFLRTIPEAINDTIYYSLKNTDSLNLKLYFNHIINDYCLIEIIYDLKQDTLMINNDEWGTYTLFGLEPGTKILEFKIHSKYSHPDDSYPRYTLESESRRVFRLIE